MQWVRFVILCEWLYLLGGRRVLALGLIGAVLTGLLLFGSLVGAIAVSRGPLPRRHYVDQPQRQAGKVREDQLKALGLDRHKHRPVTRDWNQVRQEQLRQLGLERQAKNQNNVVTAR